MNAFNEEQSLIFCVCFDKYRLPEQVYQLQAVCFEKKPCLWGQKQQTGSSEQKKLTATTWGTIFFFFKKNEK